MNRGPPVQQALFFLTLGVRRDCGSHWAGALQMAILVGTGNCGGGRRAVDGGAEERETARLFD